MAYVSSIEASHCSVCCIMLKQSFAFFPPFWFGVYKHMENKCRCIQYSLNCPPGSILCFCISFLSLFFLSNFYNPHTPYPDIRTLLRLHPDTTSSRNQLSKLSSAHTTLLESSTYRCDPHLVTGNS